MQEIVNKVLEAEKQAEEILKKARAEATSIRNAAEKEAASKLEAARTEAQAHSRDTIKKAREDAAEAHALALSKTEEKNQELLIEKAPQIKQAVDQVIKLVACPEYARE